MCVCGERERERPEDQEPFGASFPRKKEKKRHEDQEPFVASHP
jgi:hypothetical protein